MQPQFEGIDAVYKSKADNKDIRDLLVKLVPKAKAQMVTFAKQFKGRTQQETCKNIFDYIKSNFTYVADGGEQIIKLPSALLRKKVGDCKSYSLFTASILENLKIPYKFVYTSYSANPIPQHVYVVTENGCIIVVVYGIFNQEKKPTYKYTQDMNVRYMSGISGNCGCDNRMGFTLINKDKREQLKTYVKEKTQDVGDKFKTAAFVGGRQVFLFLVKNNYDGFATKIQKVDANKVKSNWEKVGGDYKALTAAIKEGASKPSKKLGLLGRIKTLFAKKGVNGIGAMSDGEIQAAIVAAATTLGSAIPAVGTAAGASVGAVLAGVYPMIVDMVKLTPATDMTGGDAPTTPTTPTSPIEQGATETSFDFGKILPIIAVGGAILYFVTKKK